MRIGITRLYKAMWYTQVGRSLEQADQQTDYDDMFDENDDDIIQHFEESESIINYPESIRGEYEDIIRQKQSNIQRYKQAIGQLIALVEQMKNSLKKLDDEIDKLERMKDEAMVKQNNLTAELQKQGKSDEEIEQHPDHILYVTLYNDHQSSIEEKSLRVAKLQQDITLVQDDIDRHKNSITFLHRDLEKIKTEQSEAVADFIAVREQEEINNMLSAVSSEETTEQLKRIREIRKRELEKL